MSCIHCMRSGSKFSTHNQHIHKHMAAKKKAKKTVKKAAKKTAKKRR